MEYKVFYFLETPFYFILINLRQFSSYISFHILCSWNMWINCIFQLIYSAFLGTESCLQTVICYARNFKIYFWAQSCLAHWTSRVQNFILRFTRNILLFSPWNDEFGKAKYAHAQTNTLFNLSNILFFGLWQTDIVLIWNMDCVCIFVACIIFHLIKGSIGGLICILMNSRNHMSWYTAVKKFQICCCKSQLWWMEYNYSN